MMKLKRERTNDIFLSFNGNDTRKSFTDHLDRALTQRGIGTFRDDKSLERGEDFAPELLKAIRESWGSIIVISQGYAFSHWCLKELVEIMKQRKEREHRVYPIFYHVEPSDFRRQTNSVKEAFDKHGERYNEETTQGWRAALEEVTGINGWLLQDQYESVFIEGIVKDVSEKIDAEVLDEQELEKLKTTFQTIQAWLEDAENKQYPKKGKTVKLWMDKLKNIACDMEDVLDEWNTAILKSKIEKNQGQTPSISPSSVSEVHNIPSTVFHFGGIVLCRDIAPRIKELNEKFQAIAREKDYFPFPLCLKDSCTDLKLERTKTISLIDESYVCGRDHDKDALIRLLLSDINSEGGSGNGIHLLAIVGMGGLGKTTLAQLAYNNDEVKKHFHQRIWVSVSDPFDEIRIAKAILGALKNGTSSSFNELESLVQEIHQKIAGEKFLLVLDDVWTKDERKWEPLKLALSLGSKESKILVTTRNEKVANILGCPKPFFLGVLSDKDSWTLFSKISFSGGSNQDHENLESIGRKLVMKCACLPLAIKTLASLLRLKRSRERWQRILNSPMWELDEAKNDIFSPLLLSYYDLSLPLRQCFSYCAIFPKNHGIEKDLLIKLWMAQGFLGEMQGNEMIVGEEYFETLAALSFFQEFEKDANDESIIIRCKMHDIVHDFAKLLSQTECCVLATSGIKEQGDHGFCYGNVRHLTIICDYMYRIPDPAYNLKKLRSLLLVGSGIWVKSNLDASLPKLCDQLTCLRMLNLSREKDRYGNSIRELPKEIGKLIHLRYLNLKYNGGLLELPETLCDLCNLQTLNIEFCYGLQKLPLGMEKLINLRHLQNANTRRLLMPKGMQRLTCLQTLNQFYVVKKGGIENGTSFGLEDLGKLIYLQGHLEIGGLGDVGVGEVSEAREARLSAKVGLHSLSLNFKEEIVCVPSYGKHFMKVRGVEKQTRKKDQQFVLQALQPPQQLQILEIQHCKGPAFPNWMTSVTLLKSVKISCCSYWESLPPMGKLPYLESLYICGMVRVKKVGEEFLGVETPYVNHIIAFSNLKTLRFQDMNYWEEWEYENLLRNRGDNSSPNITAMPKLQCLSIRGCQLLKMLPRHLLQTRALQTLTIKGSRILYSRFNGETGEDRHSISHIPTVNVEI